MKFCEKESLALAQQPVNSGELTGCWKERRCLVPEYFYKAEYSGEVVFCGRNYLLTTYLLPTYFVTVTTT